MRTSRLALAVIFALSSPPVLFAADDLLPADKPIEEAIDHYVDARLQEAKVTPAPLADDATLIRRLTLDIVGRIPTVAETQAFARSADPDKRVKLVDRLMASPGFVRHQATEFDAMLMEGKGSVRDYLLRALADNRPWSQIFRELVVADETDPKLKGAAEFLKPRLTDLDKLTNDVSAIFFGVNISCARCHDHPKVDDWKQDHFFGMKSFFNRTFDNGGFVAEREVGLVKFKTKKGQDKQAQLMFLTGKVIADPTVREGTAEEQKKEKELFEEFKKKKQAPPAPRFSARAKLVETALEPEQRDYFARAIVNRLWYRMYGSGLVMPLDQMHSANPPSHPELLDWLARDTVDHNYDLRRMIRGLVLSKTYARSSRWHDDKPPRASLFAVAQVRPLTPMQLATSLRLATTDPASLPDTLKPEDFEKRIEGVEGSSRGFASLIEQPRDDFQISVMEALLFSNGDRIQKEYLAEGGDRLLSRLKQINDPKEVVETAVRAVFCREPTAEEIKLLTGYLERKTDRPLEGRRQLIWALVSSAEFRFNY
jgi:hypothetical protein